MLRRAIILISLVPILFVAPGSHASDLAAVEAPPRMDFSLPDLDGRQRSLDEFAGKILLVNFWASWCPPCIKEMPSIRRLAEQMRSRPFSVIGVNVAEAERRVQTAVKRLRIAFPVLLDRESALFERWNAKVLPATYVLDAEGRVRYVGRGPLEWDSADVVQILESLIEEVEATDL